MRKLLYLLILCLGTTISFSQTASVKGVLKDTSMHIPLKDASVQLLRAKDSVLITFTRTAADGSFQTKKIPSGRYILLITYPRYADYADILELEKEEDVGQLPLLTQATALQNVIVRGGGAIRIKGDTTSFMADSFKVREGASVEDLLKKLPGFTVNSKGEITAQGQKIEKVLVDGEEFFGDDPTMATQNLQAAAVKEVQLFDKKSDQATFTGVDDGQKSKTLNLKLKDEAKNGYFGKINLGAGIPRKWDNTAMLNAFKSKRKLSGYGQMSNTGRTGLNWQDERNYGGDINSTTTVSDDGGIYINSNDDFGSGWGGNFGGQGLPRSWSGGVNYTNKYNADKNTLNGTYRYQKLNLDGTTSTQTQYILPSPDTSYNINENTSFKSSKERHKARGIYDITVDSLNSLRFTADGATGQSVNLTEYSRQTLSVDGRLINQQKRSTNGSTKNNNFNSSGLWRKKFAKARRTLSVNFNETYSQSEGTNFLLSNEKYYTGGNLVKDTVTDQMKTSNNWSLGIDTKASYTEPVSKNAIVELNYGYNVKNSQNELNSFDKLNGKYEKLNLITSNNYRFTTQTHSAGASYAYSTKKVKFGLGGNIAQSLWNQDDLRKDTSRNYNFTNFFPRANFSYSFTQQSSLRLNYNGNTQAPSLNQLQPIVNNIDPLNIAVGNPNLKQSFNHSINLSYSSYKVLSERGIWANIGFNAVNNAFSTNDRVDSGRRYYQTVNVSGNYSTYGYLSYSFKWKKPDMYVSFDLSNNNSRNRNFVNRQANTTTSQRYGLETRLSQYKEKKYNFSIAPGITWNSSVSSVQKELATRYWNGSLSGDGGYQLPWNFYINTDFDYQWRQRTSIFTQNNNVFLWNASLEKKILKKKTASITLKVFDILNQNVGINRDIRSNYIKQTNYDIIRRYGTLSFVWNFSKNGKAPGESDD